MRFDFIENGRVLRRLLGYLRFLIDILDGLEIFCRVKELWMGEEWLFYLVGIIFYFGLSLGFWSIKMGSLRCLVIIIIIYFKEG